jgi:hypothetical protein
MLADRSPDVHAVRAASADAAYMQHAHAPAACITFALAGVEAQGWMPGLLREQ